LFGNFADKTPPAGFVPNQTFCSEHFERLSQGRSRDFQVLTKSDLIDKAALAKCPGKYLVSQLLCDFIVQGVVDKTHGCWATLSAVGW
jgi:hypothetical protein